MHHRDAPSSLSWPRIHSSGHSGEREKREMDSGGEDTRKKRGAPASATVERRDVTSHREGKIGPVQQDRSKKLRPERQGQKSDTHKTLVEPQHTGGPGCVVDVETAISRLVAKDDWTKEKLSNDTSVKFRAGHTGDATAIALFFKQQRRISHTDISRTAESHEGTYKTQEGKIESSPSLEHWLSEALGDEDTPPSLFSLLAHVSSTSNDDSQAAKSKQLGAVALLTLNWEDNKRQLRVEWFRVDKDLQESKVLESRIWLRLSALALMTGSTLSFTDDIRIDAVRI